MDEKTLPIKGRARVLASPVASLGNVKFKSPVSSVGNVQFGETVRVAVPSSPAAKRWADYTPTASVAGELLYPSTPTPHAGSLWMQNATPAQAFGIAAGPTVVPAHQNGASMPQTMQPEEVGAALFRSMLNFEGDSDSDEEGFPTELPYNVKNTFIDDIKDEDDDIKGDVGTKTAPASLFAVRTRQAVKPEITQAALGQPSQSYPQQARILNTTEIAATSNTMSPQTVTMLPAQPAAFSPQTMTLAPQGTQVMQAQPLMMPAQPFTMVMVPQQTGPTAASATSVMMPMAMAPSMAMPPSAMAPVASAAPATMTLAPAMMKAASVASSTAPAATGASAIVPLSIRQPQPSEGAALHGTGQCRPCAWYWKPQGCANAVECRHCHMCPEGELKNRKKDKVQQMRATNTR